MEITYQECLDRIDKFWKENNFCDNIEVSDEVKFNTDGCQMCGYIYGKSLANDTYECKDFNGNEFDLCESCVNVAVTGCTDFFSYRSMNDMLQVYN